ncbi:hypothetical protein AB0M92_37935 [Streptomyces sp. NPDC051582]|uniref:hypothetical protein n=1 Tax=Streptomyces sp. NPDC051582 TaxID=3155167 RepID=UPI003423B402
MIFPARELVNHGFVQETCAALDLLRAAQQPQEAGPPLGLDPGLPHARHGSGQRWCPAARPAVLPSRRPAG